MKVTTSRDPSPKTRRFGKVLARFLSLPYENRGKRGLTDEPCLMVAEEHGNPHRLIKRSAGEETTLVFTVSSDPLARQFKPSLPVVVGAYREAEPIARFFELDWREQPGYARAIMVAGGYIDLVDGQESILRLKI